MKKTTTTIPGHSNFAQTQTNIVTNLVNPEKSIQRVIYVTIQAPRMWLLSTPPLDTFATNDAIN